MSFAHGVRAGLCACLALFAFDGDAIAARAKARAPNCSAFKIDAHADQPLHPVTRPPPDTCQFQSRNGFPVPDPACTPGATNPTVTLAVLQDKRFRTACVRNKATTPSQKAQTYRRYAQKHPAHNTGKSQTCELDHFISLELGGADTLDNIWPQCGPSRVALANRYFKQKDIVENFLAWLVKNNRMNLEDAQYGIANDWTQYLDAAKRACPGGRCRDANLPPARW
jgi:5-methylcytosine-specific restriction endonuclease McrA